MNNLQEFNFNTSSIRTIENENGTWFVLKDICNALELTNPSMVVERLDEDERTKFNLGRQGDTTFINESGLYSVILRSDKPQAKPFRKWVTQEVIPTIRKTGTYNHDKPLSTLELLNTAAAEVKATEERNQELTDVLLAYQKYGSSMLVREFVKIAYAENKIEIREHQMWNYLRKYYLDKNDLPLARYRDYFEVIYRFVGREKKMLKSTTKITPRGANYFINKLLKELDEVN